MDARCDECEKVKKERSEDLLKRDEWQIKQDEEDKKYYEERKTKRENNPELFMGDIPLKFRDKSLDNFTGSEEVKKILREYSDRFIKEEKYLAGEAFFSGGLVQYPGSILFTGKTGCGKTHLAVSVVRELVKRGAGVNYYFTTAPELLLEIRDTFNKNSKAKAASDDGWNYTIQTESDVIDKYSTCELLILDDLGAEKISDFTIQSLYLVIDRRNKNLKPTIVTTNLSLEEIETLIDARMASRLSDMKIIKLNMPDYRKKR